MFEELSDVIQEEVVRYLLRIQIERPEEAALEPAPVAPDGAGNGGLVYEHDSVAGADAIRAAGAAGGEAAAPAPALAGSTAGSTAGAATTVSTGQRTVSAEQRVGRNDPCWCGSGKKFKKCHGA
jgi:preprotein translocase subunit SecA